MIQKLSFGIAFVSLAVAALAVSPLGRSLAASGPAQAVQHDPDTPGLYGLSVSLNSPSNGNGPHCGANISIPAGERFVAQSVHGFADLLSGDHFVSIQISHSETDLQTGHMIRTLETIRAGQTAVAYDPTLKREAPQYVIDEQTAFYVDNPTLDPNGAPESSSLQLCANYVSSSNSAGVRGGIQITIQGYLVPTSAAGVASG